MAKLNLKLSKKQQQVLNDIISPNVPEIYILGSTQSGKTFVICLAVILYAQALYKYNPDEKFFGAIVGWSITTIKGNIADVIENFLKNMGLKKKKNGKGDYEIHWGGDDDKYFEIYNTRFLFYGFNTKISYNKILGKPLIFEWIDESARIYSSSQLQESFKELPTRQMSYATNPFKKTIHSFNVEGNENHPYKIDFIDGKPNAKHYTFFPYDNPKLDTAEAMKEVANTFPNGSALQRQKVFNEWCVGSGKVFEYIETINSLENYIMREIGIGIDYGSTNPTTFVPILLAYNSTIKKWELIRLQVYYHDPKREQDNPTTEYYSNQLRLFLVYLKQQFPHIPITTCVLDSEATHFHNRLLADNIQHSLATKGAGSVDVGVQHLQSLIYKGYFKVLKHNSIIEMLPDGKPIYSGKDEGLIELESYQYDTIRCVKTGVNCYKKEADHSVDGIRYLLFEWKETGRCPEV